MKQVCPSALVGDARALFDAPHKTSVANFADRRTSTEVTVRWVSQRLQLQRQLYGSSAFGQGLVAFNASKKTTAVESVSSTKAASVAKSFPDR